MKDLSGGKIRVSSNFVNALSIVSILSFVGIVSYTLFDYNLNHFVEAFLMIIIGLGLVLEARWKKLRTISKKGITPYNFTHLTTVIIGFIAVIAGIFSLPSIRIENPSFLAIKGIVSIIAIVFIIIQTWFIE
jgi:hypothetical protein